MVSCTAVSDAAAVQPPFEEQCKAAKWKVFDQIRCSPSAIHSLLQPPTVASQIYNMRSRTHITDSSPSSFWSPYGLPNSKPAYCTRTYANHCCWCIVLENADCHILFYSTNKWIFRYKQLIWVNSRAVIAVAIFHDIATTGTMSRYRQTNFSTVFYYIPSYKMCCLLIHGLLCLLIHR